MNILFSKIRNIIKKIKICFTKQQHESNPDMEYRKLLSPCIIPTSGSVSSRSVEDLRFAIDSEDCNNIAVTGGYGSGKSSVIKTYIKQNPKKRILKISLSNFIESNDIQEKEKFLEFKIFQHIFYKVKPSQTSPSRYRRMLYITHRQAICFSIRILLLFVSFWVLFEPKFLAIDSLYELYFKLLGEEKGAILNAIFDIFSLSYILCFMGLCIYYLLKRWRGDGIKSITTKYVELEFDDKKSAFSDMLEEIQYYLVAGEFDIVLFEDIDRISDTQSLFLKLRELNILLNDSEYWVTKRKPIKFVYAIKDDLFTSEIRTKCFDYVVPIIPIVDKYNAGDYLINNYSKSLLHGIGEKDISELGIYIHDMRQLINIINEYGLYKDVVIQGEMSKTKLLAVIIYKNLFPNDFSLLQQQKGCLYSMFNNKCIFDASVIASKNEKIKRIEEQIQEKKKHIERLRGNVTEILWKNHHIVKLYIEDVPYTLSEFESNDSLYAKLVHNQIEKYYYENGDECGTYNYSLKFSDIVKELDSDWIYQEEMYNYESKLFPLNDELSKLRREVNLVRQTSLQKTIALIKDGNVSLEHTKSICEKAIKDNAEKMYVSDISSVLHSLIRNGYIAEDYSSYISYYYPGSKKEEDYKFLNSILQGIPLPYDFKINNPSQIINSLHTENFTHKESLNYHIFSYILNKKGDSLSQVIIQTARQYPDFLVSYYKTANYSESFISLLFSNWNHCVRDIMNNTGEEEKYALYEMLFIACPTDISFDKTEISVLNGLFEFICDRIEKFDVNHLIKFINTNKLKFERLVDPANSNAKKIYSYVLLMDRFEINLKNLLVIYSERFMGCSYQCIREGLHDVKEYLDKNISTVIDLFPDSDVEENAESIVELSNNHDISDEQFEKLLIRQTIVLDSINGVDESRIQFFFVHDKIKPTWANVMSYFSFEDNHNKLIPYIHKHADELANYTIEEDENKALQSLLFNDNSTLSFDIYQKLLSCCKHFFNANDLVDLNDERLLCIINNDYIEYLDEIKGFFSNKSAEVYAAFLIKKIDSLNDDETFDADIPNSVGIMILDSTLTLDQKKQFINERAKISDDSEKIAISQRICFYTHQIGIDNATNINLLLEAMELWQDPDSWWCKISLINEVNNTLGYEEKREIKMLNSLGGEYKKLSTYRGISHFEDKPENRQLLAFLQSNAPYISRLIDVDGQIKVTYKFES